MSLPASIEAQLDGRVHSEIAESHVASKKAARQLLNSLEKQPLVQRALNCLVIDHSSVELSPFKVLIEGRDTHGDGRNVKA